MLLTIVVTVRTAKGQPSFEYSLKEGEWLSESKLDQTVFALYGLQADGSPHELDLEFPEGLDPKRIG